MVAVYGTHCAIPLRNSNSTVHCLKSEIVFHCIFVKYNRNCVKQDSSVSIVSGYELDDQVRYPAEAKDYSLYLCVQNSSGAHPASCPMGNMGPFLWGKARPERDADHSPPSCAEVMNEYELHLLSPCASIGVLYDCFTFLCSKL
jgi:hypothetical protein